MSLMKISLRVVKKLQKINTKIYWFSLLIIKIIISNLQLVVSSQE